jgi:hypothetical protein
MPIKNELKGCQFYGFSHTFVLMRFITTGLLMLLALQACKNKCTDLKSDVSGSIVKAYDFGTCLIYANIDSNRVIDSDTAWNSFKNRYLQNCNPAELENIDFTKHMLVGFKVTEYACNLGMHRKLIIDDVAKTYTYQITVEACGGCNSRLSSPNWVLMPQLPPGYSMRFRKLTQ